MSKLVLPELGEGIETAIIACWHYSQGDIIKKEEDVVEVVTDKASFNVPAIEDGQLKEIYYTDGQEVRVGEVLALIE